MTNPFAKLIQNVSERFSANKIPKILFYVIIFYAVALNIIYALIPPNFFHPDEVYQSLEVAHKIVYGYGIISWEWQVGAFKIGNTAYGPIRSMITPLIIAIFFVLGNILNLNYWNVVLPLIRVSLDISFLIGLYFASKILKELNPDKFSQSDKIFLVLVLFFHDTFLYGSKALTNTMVASFVFIALYIWIKTNKTNSENTSQTDSEHNPSRFMKIKTHFFESSSLKNEFYEFIGGFFVGLAIWMRPDSAFLMGFLVLVTIDRIQLNKTINFAMGFVVSALLDGILDLIYYGKFFETFINFVVFNMAHQSLFGTYPFGWYFMTFVINQGSFFYLFVLTLIVLVVMGVNVIMQRLTKKYYPNVIKEFILLVQLFIWVFLDLIWWETQPHKEYRFMILWEVIFLLLGAYTLSLVAKYIRMLFERAVLDKNYGSVLNALKKYNTKNKYAILIFIIVLLSVPYFRADVQETAQISWNNFRDVLEASVWVGQQNVTGLGIIMPLYYSGGYTYLHRDVVIYNINNPFDISSVDPSPNVTSVQEGVFVPGVLANLGMINYLIVPIYRNNEFPTLNASIYSNGFKLVKVLYGSCDIFYI